MNMSGPTLYQFPRVKDPDTFERIVRDCLAEKYGQQFEQYGRKGQEQNGIDLWSRDKKYGVQCKNYLKADKTAFKQAIRGDYRAAIKHFDDMEHFVAATALSRDTDIQELMKYLSDDVPIEVVFWEDIEEILSKTPRIAQYYYPNFHDHPLEKPKLNRPIWWIDPCQDEAGFWFNDRYPLLLDSFLMAAAGRGVIFLISDWPGGIGAALNGLAEKEKLPLTWKELPLGKYAGLSPEDSGAVLTIRDNLDEAAELMKQCLQHWEEVEGRYQLIFNFCVSTWQRELVKIREMVKYLRSRFLRAHFDLISTLDPFFPVDEPEEGGRLAASNFLAELEASGALPSEADLLKQVHRHPEQCRALLCLAVRFQTLQPVIFSFASHSFTALRTLLDELQAEAVSNLLKCGLLSGLQPDWDLCVWEFYRRCCSDQVQWKLCLSLAAEQCSDAMRALIAQEALLVPPPAETKYLFYLLERASEAQVQTYLCRYEPSSPPYLAILLCSRHAFGRLMEKLSNRRLAEQYRAILIPESFHDEDEMTASSRSEVRPIL